MFKILRQELLFIPLMLLLVELFRWGILAFYPETALFDRGSELETFIFRVWQITWITSAVWLLMRVIFPPGFKAITRFYHKFDRFDDEYKENTALKIFLVFFLSLVYLIGRGQHAQDHLRKQLIDTLTSQLYVREATGQNDGVEVERYLKYVGRYKGDAWCAAYVSTNLHYIGIERPLNPVSAWAPSFANPKYVISSQALSKAHKSKPARPGDVFTLYYPAQGRVGHTGFIIAYKAEYYITNEGNTGSSGTREGSGVHSLKRSKIKIYAISDYITPYIHQYEKDKRTTTVIHTGFLHSQNNGLCDVNQRGEMRQYLCTQGFYLVQGYTAYSARIFCHDTGTDPGGSQRVDQPATGDIGKQAIQGQCFNFKWKAYSQLCLQIPGVKGSASAATYPRASKKEQHKAKGTNYLQDKGSPLYT